MSGSWSGTTYNGDLTNETVQGTAADEIIVGAGGSDTLRGGAGNDQIFANDYYSEYYNSPTALDRLYGEAGDDTLAGYAYAPKGSVLDGGAGAGDRAILRGTYVQSADANKPVVFALSSGGSSVTVGGEQRLLVKGVESLDWRSVGDNSRVSGGANADTIVVSGKNTTLSGGGGDDYLDANLFAGAKLTVDGGSGSADTLRISSYGFADLTLKMSGSFAKGLTFSSANAVVGTVKGIETLSVSGGSGNDVLFGGDGNDYLGGSSGGTDRLVGNGGDDTINCALTGQKSIASGGAGIDTLILSPRYGDASAITMSGSLQKLTATTGGALSLTASGFERLYVSTEGGDDSVFGGALDDSFAVRGGANTVAAGAGDDTISTTLDAKLDKIDGGAGADLLTLDPVTSDQIRMSLSKAGLLSIALNGVASVQASHTEALKVFAGSAADTLTGLAGDDTLFGAGGNDTIHGNDGNDQIDGSTGNDRLYGGAGNDVIFTGSGFDIVDGGTGIDTVRLAGPRTDNAGVTVTLMDGKTVTVTAGGEKVATLTGIENVIGGDFNDRITGDSGANTIGGASGSNILNGGAGVDTVDYSALGMFTGLQSGVTVNLKNGAASKVQTGTDNGLPTGKAIYDTISNFENATGTSRVDTLIGDSRANVLNGNGGADTLKGGAGNDTYIVNDRNVLIQELKGGGVDTVMAGSDYALRKGQEIETLIGTADSVIGADVVINHKLAGNEFANTIQGWLGSDTLTGGAGKDTFLFNTSVSNGFIDTITDFSVKDDTIGLGRSVFTAFGSGHDVKASEFVVGAAAKTADQHLIYNSATGVVFYDSDGSNKAHAAVAFALLDPHLKLTAADFVVV